MSDFTPAELRDLDFALSARIRELKEMVKLFGDDPTELSQLLCREFRDKLPRMIALQDKVQELAYG